MAKAALAEIETEEEGARLPDQPNLEPGPNERLISTYDVEFLLKNVVSPGDTFTEQQALFFNIQYHNFMTKSFAPTLKKMKEEDASWNEINSAYQTHCANYQWRPRGDGTSLDPIEREMVKLARELVNHSLKKRGLPSLTASVRQGKMTTEEVDEYLAGVVEQNADALRAKVVERRRQASEFADTLQID